MADWKSEVLNKLVITKEMVDYVMEKYGNKCLVDDDVGDEILDDLLKREFEKQQRLKGKELLKDDKASLTRIDILDDPKRRIDNVEVVLNKAKRKIQRKHVIVHFIFSDITNYILVAELIILDLDTSSSIESLNRSSFSKIPPSTHPFQTSSDNAIDSSSEHTLSLTDVVETKRPPPVRNCILGLGYVKTYQQILKKNLE
ncbi:hypothetical protein Tco_0885850 [Tanacetum coccineum]